VSALIIFLTAIAVIVFWWLSHQRLMSKPWLEEGESGEFVGGGPSSLPASKIGLGVFLAVVGSLFALLISVYFMRMDMADWTPPPAPQVLWLNTGALVMSSAMLHWALVAARRGQIDDVRSLLFAAGVFALVFLMGQLLAWRQLTASGYYLASNPANAFFYLMTGLHGAHLLGGLVALARTADKVWRGAELAQVRLSVELCATYWHFLLLLWFVLFSVLMHWADDVVLMCRHLLS
jgi:cytochrome c oxidase subunit 3